jgi:hypothetical protein
MTSRRAFIGGVIGLALLAGIGVTAGSGDGKDEGDVTTFVPAADETAETTTTSTSTTTTTTTVLDAPEAAESSESDDPGPSQAPVTSPPATTSTTTSTTTTTPPPASTPVADCPEGWYVTPDGQTCVPYVPPTVTPSPGY